LEAQIIVCKACFNANSSGERPLDYSSHRGFPGDIILLIHQNPLSGELLEKSIRAVENEMEVRASMAAARSKNQL
jgi:hypothetical protein